MLLCRVESFRAPNSKVPLLNKQAHGHRVQPPPGRASSPPQPPPPQTNRFGDIIPVPTNNYNQQAAWSDEPSHARTHARTSSPNRVSYRDLDCATRELPPGAAAPLVVVNSPYRSASSPALRPPPLVEDPAGDPKKSASPPSTSLLFPTPPTARRMEADCGGDWLLWVFLEVEPTAGDADADADPPLPPPPPKKWVDLSIHFRGVGARLL